MKTKTYRLPLFLAVTILTTGVVAPCLNAVVITEYPLEDGSAAPSFTQANMTADDFVVSSFFTVAGISAATDTAYARSDATPGSESATITNGGYFSFTVQPDEGFQIDLSSLTFDTAFNGTDSASSAQANYFVRSSLDNYSTNISSIFTENYQAVASTPSTVFTTRTVDLSGLEFQGLTESTEFRIYVYDNSVSQGKFVRFNQVVLSGAVIPEPSETIAVMTATALFGLLIFRRNRR